MAATPEDPAEPADEPFSPSVFLDLPPTPQPQPVGDGDGDGEDSAASSGDLAVLPFIRRMLMEEEDADDDIIPDHHPALLQARQPFAQILSGSAATGSGSGTFTVSPSPASSADVPAFADAASLAGLQLQQQSVGKEANAFLYGAEEEGLVLPAADGDGVVTMEMLNQAFLKGMEEASKLLPATTTDSLLPGGDYASNKQRARAVDGGIGMPFFRGRGCKNRHGWDEDADTEAEAGRRSSVAKLTAPAPDESGEVDDDVFHKAYVVALQKMQGLGISSSVPPPGPGEVEESHGRRRRRRRQRSSSDEAVDLRTLLMHCAEAVSTGNTPSATELLRHIKQRSSPTGDAWQRLAHCFAQGLELRLAGGTGVAAVAEPNRASAADLLRAHQLCIQVCCFQMASFDFSHTAICNATAGRDKVHIVAYGEHYGFQWPLLLGHLAAREGGPPAVRLTVIGSPQPGFRPAARVNEIGRRFTALAAQCGHPFTFRGIVAARWDTVCAEDVGVEPDEVLVVDGLLQFKRLSDEGVVDGSIDSPSPRDMVLANIREMRPDLFVLCVENSSCGAPFFVTRFRQALFYYSAMFDMMDATAPRDKPGRVVLEQEVMGPCAVNVIACEGSERVERPETYKQWQVRCRRAGLRQLPLDPSAVKRLRDKVRNGYHEDFVIDMDQQWLLQGWKGRILYAISTWTWATTADP